MAAVLQKSCGKPHTDFDLVFDTLSKKGPMHARRLSYSLVLLTFLLVLLGGVVHVTGSSLACPDWPLCYGMVFPPMQGGILFEHSHRLLASAVTFCTVALCFAVWRQAGRQLRVWALGGIGLVLFQACLGGLTVLWRLPPPVSIAHLATSMLFFAWALAMVLRLQHPWDATVAMETTPARARQLLGWATGLLYVQIVLGAAVRHTGSSMSCGAQALWCGAGLLPENGPQWLQTSHRALAFLVMGLIVASTIPVLRFAKSCGWQRLYRLALASHVVVLLQMLLGILTLRTGIHLHVVTTHLGLGLALWGIMVSIWMLLGPLGAIQREALQVETSTQDLASGAIG